MNKIGIYYGYWTKDWVVDFSKYVEKAQALGFDIIEYDLGAILSSSESYKKKLKNAIKKSDLDICFCISIPENMDISGADSRERSRGIDFLKKAIEITNEFGGKNLSGVLYGIWGKSLKPGEETKELFLKRSLISMREIIKTAEKYDVQCNIEVVNRYEQFLINTCKEAVEYVEKVNSPNIKIHLDTFHMNIEEDSYINAIKTAGQHLGHFHIGANNRKLPGEGHLNWPAIASALKDIDYNGAIVMEPFTLQGGDVARDIKVWRSGNETNRDKKAQEAKNYIRDLLN